MIERADRVIVAVDSTKIGQTTLAKMADISEIHALVTDAGAPEDELRRIRDAGVDVHVVDGLPSR